MAREFDPNLSILPEQQRRLWPELAGIPDSFVLFGGTAIALQLAHRQSLDFDFITTAEFDPDSLYDQIPFLQDSTAVQKSASTLTCVVDRQGAVQLSFFGAPSIRLIYPALVAADNGLRVATLLDLAGMKAAVVQKRAEAKDFVDLDAIIESGAVNLPTALSAAIALYGRRFNPELTLKSLCYFDAGNLQTLPPATQHRLTAAVQSVDLDRLPELKQQSN
jgi:hypothetical protein